MSQTRTRQDIDAERTKLANMRRQIVASHKIAAAKKEKSQCSATQINR